MPKYETREVLFDAYADKRTTQFRSHAVEVDDKNRAIRVLCRRVAFSSLADRGAGNPADPPTCPACRSKLNAIIKGKST